MTQLYQLIICGLIHDAPPQLQTGVLRSLLRLYILSTDASTKDTEAVCALFRSLLSMVCDDAVLDCLSQLQRLLASPSSSLHTLLDLNTLLPHLSVHSQRHLIGSTSDLAPYRLCAHLEGLVSALPVDLLLLRNSPRLASLLQDFATSSQSAILATSSTVKQDGGTTDSKKRLFSSMTMSSRPSSPASAGKDWPVSAGFSFLLAVARATQTTPATAVVASSYKQLYSQQTGATATTPKSLEGMGQGALMAKLVGFLNTLSTYLDRTFDGTLSDDAYRLLDTHKLCDIYTLSSTLTRALQRLYGSTLPDKGREKVVNIASSHIDRLQHMWNTYMKSFTSTYLSSYSTTVGSNGGSSDSGDVWKFMSLDRVQCFYEAYVCVCALLELAIRPSDTTLTEVMYIVIISICVYNYVYECA